MTRAGVLSVTLSVPPYVRTYERLSKRRPLSKSNTFDQNFMKLGHHDVFFKFDNGPYRTMLSVVMDIVYENSPFETMSAL